MIDNYTFIRLNKVLYTVCHHSHHHSVYPDSIHSLYHGALGLLLLGFYQDAANTFQLFHWSLNTCRYQLVEVMECF